MAWERQHWLPSISDQCPGHPWDRLMFSCPQRYITLRCSALRALNRVSCIGTDGTDAPTFLQDSYAHNTSSIASIIKNRHKPILMVYTSVNLLNQIQISFKKKCYYDGLMLYSQTYPCGNKPLLMLVHFRTTIYT